MSEKASPQGVRITWPEAVRVAVASPRRTAARACARVRIARLAGAPRGTVRGLRAVALASAAVLLLAIAGCGGSSETTKAQYISKVNALCLSERQQLTQIALAKTKLSVALERATTAREQVLAQIEAVKLPKSGPISPEWLALRRQALALAKRIGALGLGSRAARQLNREYVAASNRAERLALAYGLTACRGFAAV